MEANEPALRLYQRDTGEFDKDNAERLSCILTPAGPLGGLSSRDQTLFGVFLTREAERLHEMTKLGAQGA